MVIISTHIQIYYPMEAEKDNYPFLQLSKETENTSLLRQPASWRRPIVMIIWKSWPKNILIMIGRVTKAIQRKNIVMASDSMALVHIIAKVTIFWVPRN